jgi:hypothetical protein
VHDLGAGAALEQQPGTLKRGSGAPENIPVPVCTLDAAMREIRRRTFDFYKHQAEPVVST